MEERQGLERAGSVWKLKRVCPHASWAAAGGGMVRKMLRMGGDDWRGGGSAGAKTRLLHLVCLKMLTRAGWRSDT